MELEWIWNGLAYPPVPQAPFLGNVFNTVLSGHEDAGATTEYLAGLIENWLLKGEEQRKIQD